MALTTTHAPPAALASTSRTRAGPPSRMSARLTLRTSSGRIVPPLFSATKTRRSEAPYPNAASFANSVSPTGISPAAVRAQWMSAAVTRPASRKAGTSRTPS